MRGKDLLMSGRVGDTGMDDDRDQGLLHLSLHEARGLSASSNTYGYLEVYAPVVRSCVLGENGGSSK